ncbi:VOC family protein [Streptomyces sp. TRM 70361]|uniref:VOC family protein n=1 Tax=Streptomyces sp. TRM 70361 TaxID=3116553 RepID=UPI002E7B930D|nr:VOC family protein [Streptomyces sp. TRM 70361]MEE1942697.1 VOC family protein [Streptomyces sp. TRM 70361]
MSSSSDPRPAPGPFTALGRLVVLVSDADEALAFYRDVLGFRVLYDGTAGGYRCLHVGVPGQEGTGLWLMPATGERERALVGRQTGGQPLLVLYTGDLAAVAGRLREHGIRIRDEREDADSSSLHFADLYGNVLVAVELRVPASA